MKRTVSLLMCVLMLFSLIPYTAYGDSDNVYNIKSVDDLIKLAEKCNIDSYSQNLTVKLRNDLDLSGSGFTSIPYFSGIFDGNDYTITNYSVTSDGSHIGFFRYISENAFVSDLNIEGKLAPSGSGCTVGGIAGVNNGVISGCSFSGKVIGVDCVGGIAGSNTGTISNCYFDGEAVGEHKIGGIAGENSGIVSDCENTGRINTVTVTPRNSSAISFTGFDFDIAEISEEDFLDITDIGGIAGYSDGIVEKCTNKGDVGYDRIGYNVGGIVGRESGYVNNCNNNGIVLGRKDVGGIVGQLEPYTAWDFSESKLTDLENELDELSKRLEKISEDSENSSENLSNSLNSVQNYIRQTSDDTQSIINQTSDNIHQMENTAEEITQLISDSIAEHNHEKTKELIVQLKEKLQSGEIIVEIPDMISILEQLVSEEKNHFKDDHFYSEFDLIDEMEQIIADNSVSPPDSGVLFDDFQNIMNSVSDVKGNITNGSDTLKKNVNSAVEQCQVVFDTFFSTTENVAEINTDYETDVSLNYSDNYTVGAVSSCKNYAEVNAETNVGGIVGSVSFEISFDAEDKLNVSEYLLSDAKYMIFAVVKNSESYSDITAKKACAGGIVGNMDFGAVLNSVGAGTIKVTNGDYCGGVVGQGKGNVKNCYSRSVLSGTKYVGGIAGDGENISDCKSYSFIDSGKEYFGTIAGNISGSVENSFFVQNEVGAVDGISYKGNAEPVTYDEMLRLDGIPDVFRKIVVTFVKDDEIFDEIEVPFGGGIGDLPEVPMNGVQYWKWDDFDKEHIYYSLTVNGDYYNPKTTIATKEEFPLFLVEGNFYEGQKLIADEFSVETQDSAIEQGTILSAYTLRVTDYSGELKVRMRNSEKGILYVIGNDGKYNETDYEVDGSYIVFNINNGDSIVFVQTESDNTIIWIIGGIAVAVILVLAVVLIIRKIRKNKRKRK